eukprot:588154-Prorocentrum_minimum.AAC.1
MAENMSNSPAKKSILRAQKSVFKNAVNTVSSAAMIERSDPSRTSGNIDYCMAKFSRSLYKRPITNSELLYEHTKPPNTDVRSENPAVASKPNPSLHKCQANSNTLGSRAIDGSARKHNEEEIPPLECETEDGKGEFAASAGVHYIRAKNFVIFQEHESNCWTTWYMQPMIHRFNSCPLLKYFKLQSHVALPMYLRSYTKPPGPGPKGRAVGESGELDTE